MKWASRTLAGVTTCGVFTAVSMFGAASAAHAAKPDTTATTLAPCIAEAAERKAEAWMCTAAGLTIMQPAANASTFIAVAPAVAPRVEPRGVILADDYDSWCESGSTCHRNPSQYISETKGNGAWGDQGVG
jgi:hypothetical protein